LIGLKKGEPKMSHILKYMPASDFLDWMLECSAVLPVLDLLEITSLQGYAVAGHIAKVITEGRKWQLSGEGFSEYDERGWEYPNIEEEVEKTNKFIDGFFTEETPVETRILWAENLIKSNLNEGIFKKGSTLLDVGTNYGQLLFYLARKIPEINFVGLEPNKTEFEVGYQLFKKRKEPNILNWINGTLEELPHEEKYDFIMINEVLEHVAFPGRIIQSALDRLKPNGYILGSVPINCCETGIPLERRCHLTQFTHPSLRRLFGPRIELSIENMLGPNSVKPFGFFLFVARKKKEKNS
jgi:2-polyprenyl-3-methyl-5-hydroxy-6-metoxy-1,4-benzoquinol methylase